MDMTLSNGFCELTQNEMEEIDGGGVLLGVGKFLIDYTLGKVIDYLFKPVICY